MAKIIHFEVYIHDGRGWSLQSRHPASKRESALAEAASIEVDMKRPVRVVRESHDEETGASSEQVVWTGRYKEGGGAATPAPRSGGKSPSANSEWGGGTTGSAPAGGTRPAAHRREMTEKTLSDYTIHLLGIIAVSVLAGVVTVMLLPSMLYGSHPTQAHLNALQLLNPLIFAGVFGGCTGILILILIPKKVLFGGDKGASGKASKGKSRR